MKRAELEAKLQGIENAKEIIDFVMSENGKDIESLKATHKNELAKFEGIDISKIEDLKKFDPNVLTEVEELRKFKTETETAQVRAKKESAAMKILSEKGYNEKAAKLILKAEREIVDGLELDEAGAVKNSDKFIEPISKNYADFVTRTENGGAQAGTPPTTAPQKPMTLASAVAEKLGAAK